VLTPSDDPVAAASALDVAQAQSLNDQYHTNAGAARDKLALEENALADAMRLLQDARTLAVSAGNPRSAMRTRRASRRSSKAAIRSSSASRTAPTATASSSFPATRARRGLSPRPRPARSPTRVTREDAGYRSAHRASWRSATPARRCFARYPTGTALFAVAPGAGNAGSGVSGPGTVTDPPPGMPPRTAETTR
jgi:flagellar hook-associated protein 3 FlgL